MTFTEQVITIAICVLATVLTRFLPFLIFSDAVKTPSYITFLGKALPPAIFGLLFIYCLKDATLLTGNHMVPECIGIAAAVLLHWWRRNMLLSIAGSTAVYLLYTHFVG